MTRYHRAQEEVPLVCVQGHDKDREGDTVTVTFDWAAGTSPSGLSGPPENYDPGEADEFVIVSPPGLSCEAEEQVIEYLDANWARPADEPDPDWLRDERAESA